MSEELKAGRELDALIAEKVMGAVWRPTESGSPTEQALVFPREDDLGSWSLVWRYSDGRPMRYKNMLPNYSTEVGQSFDVVDAMIAKGFHVSIETTRGYWGVRFASLPRMVEETLPLAICRSALMALAASTPPSALPTPSLTLPPSEPRP